MSHYDRSLKLHPVVLRIANMTPAQIARFEAHRLRNGEGAEHVDRTKKNQRLLGNENWAQEALALLNRMRQQNHLIEAQALRKRGRAKQLDAVLERGPLDPWDPRAEGPMREIILTAHKDWFAAGADEPRVKGRNPREVAFENVAKKWLRDNFGGDVVHARADHDETTYHIHAVILPAKKMLKRKKGEKAEVLPVPGEDLFTHLGELCKVQLVPSKHPLLRNYEKAQDSVGAAFATIGLVRGERHWAAVKQALSEGRAPSPRPRHKPAHVWREEEAERLNQQAAELTHRGQQQAQTEADLEKQAAALADQKRQVSLRETSAQARDQLLADRMKDLFARKRELADREAQAVAKEKSAAETHRKAQILARKANAVIAVADAVADGHLDVDTADLAAARQAGGLAPDLEDRIDAAPDIAGKVFIKFRRAYGVMRQRARAEIEPALAAMERTGAAWAELQRRAAAALRSGRLTSGVFGALFAGLKESERQALDHAEEDARHQRKRLDRGDER